ncbi:hypothetical protein ACOSP7_023925 [Xanthoceras sorbifolium]
MSEITLIRSTTKSNKSVKVAFLRRRLGVWGLRFSFLDLPFLPSPVWVVLGAELGCCRAAGASLYQLSEALGAVGVRRAGLRSVTGGIGSGSSFLIYL